MRDILEVFSEEHQLDSLRELSADECEAIFQLLMLAVLIDGDVTREEVSVLIEEFDHLPFFAAASTDRARREFGFRIRGELLERIGNHEVPEMLDEIASVITDPDHREAALRMVALTATAEHVEDEEYAFGFEVAEAFGIDSNETLEIFRKAWEYGHPPFHR